MKLFENMREPETFLLLLVLVLVFICLIPEVTNVILRKIEPQRKVILNVSFLLSIATYILSLCFAGYYDNHYNSEPGALLVLFGGLLAMGGGAAITWLANPILWYAWAKRKKTKNAFVASLVSTLFILLFLMFDKISGGGTTFGTDGQVGSCDIQIQSCGAGYYLWFSSSIIFLIGNYLGQPQEEILLNN